MENKFKIVCLGSLMLATEFFVLGEKEAEITDIKGGKKEFTITDAHMTFKDGVQVPKAGMDAHNNANGGVGFRDNIILEGRGQHRSEIKGQLSIKDNSVENLFIVDKNGIYVDGGSFSGADNVILSGKNTEGGPNGTIELMDLKRAKEDGITPNSRKLQVHVQDTRVIGELTKSKSKAIFNNQEKYDGTWRWGWLDKKDSERGVEIFYYYNPGDIFENLGERVLEQHTNGKKQWEYEKKPQQGTNRARYKGDTQGVFERIAWKDRKSPFEVVKLIPRPQPNPIGVGVPVQQLPVGDNLGQQQGDVSQLSSQPNVQSSPNSIPDYVTGTPGPVEGAVKKDGSNPAGSGKQGTTEGGTSTPTPYYDENPFKYAENFEEFVQRKQDRGDRGLDNKSTTITSNTTSVTTEILSEDSFGYNYGDTPRKEGVTSFDVVDKTIKPDNDGSFVDFYHLDSSYLPELISTETSSKLEGEGSAERLNLSSAQADELSAEASEDRGNRRRLEEER